MSRHARNSIATKPVTASISTASRDSLFRVGPVENLAAGLAAPDQGFTLKQPALKLLFPLLSGEYRVRPNILDLPEFRGSRADFSVRQGSDLVLDFYVVQPFTTEYDAA